MTQSVLLGDICDIKIGRTPPRKETQWFSSVSGNPWASIKDMGYPGRYISETSEYLTNEAVKKFRIPVIPRGTLMMSFKLTVGRLGFALDDMYSNEAIAQLPIVDEGVVDRMWLYYYLKNFNFNSLSSTSSIATAVNSKTVKNIPIQLIDIDRQKKIANILGSLDEKIELNRRINETLEQIGQALFRHYFIDNPEAESWKMGVVSDLVDIHSGFAFRSRDFHDSGNYKLVTIKNVQDGSFIGDCKDKIRELPANMPDYIKLSSGDVIMSLTGNVGRVCIVNGENYLLNQRVAKLVGKDGLSAFAYFLFRGNDMRNELTGLARGTAQKNLSPVETKKININVPPHSILNKFETIAGYLLENIVKNNEQALQLVKTRDSLLPKLISGDIKV